MGFWSDIGEIVGNVAVAMAEIKVITDWENLGSFEEVQDAVHRFVRYATRDQIKAAKRGFAKRLCNQQDMEAISRVMAIHYVFCVELFKRSGDDC